MNRRSNQSAFTMLECVAALGLLGLMITTLAVLLGLQRTQVEIAKHRLLRQQTLASIADQLYGLPAEQLNADGIDQSIDGWEKELGLLPGQITAELESVEQPQAGHKITLRFQAKSRHTRDAQLVIWRFGTDGSESPPGEEADQ